MHAEKIVDSDYSDSDTPLVGFFDWEQIFHRTSIKWNCRCSLHPFGATSESEIWPEENEMNISLSDLNKVKSLWIQSHDLSEVRFFEVENGEVFPVNEFDVRTPGRVRIGIRGNPSLGSIRSIMVGIKNKITYLQEVKFGSTNCVWQVWIIMAVGQQWLP